MGPVYGPSLETAFPELVAEQRKRDLLYLGLAAVVVYLLWRVRK